MTRSRVPLAALALCACAIPNPIHGINDTYWNAGGIAMVTNYPLTITRHTPAGIAVDDPGTQITDAVIDATLDRVEACLAGKPRTLDSGQSSIYEMWCHGTGGTRIPTRIDRTSLLVKVAPDWTANPDQRFPCKAGGGWCFLAVQSKSALVITPDARLLATAVVMAVTACEAPWAGILRDCTR